MFTSQEWSDLKVSDEANGRKATSIVLQVSFWDHIVYALKAIGPLIKIHSKKRNRLEHEMLQKLIFVKYNQTLKENCESDEYIDPVLMDYPEINAGSLWLLGDEVRVRDDQIDVVFDDDDDLNWLDVEEASGVVEPLFNTRSQAALQKAAAAATAPATPPPSKSKGKGKGNQGARGKQGEKVSKGKGKKVVVESA
ncbi:hypothetical protein MTR_1g055005 [Medicago truncatula]|uniref:Uncharacterized protein n=1 Tax=Medicago truncatula TaxID=3880 RepID=A0A072VJ46_MEDTR|nr:hypothetical protein MTR_1g055005 [Medicago truncatula]